MKLPALLSKIVIFNGVMLVLAVVNTTQAYAAELQVSPSTGTFSVDESFEVAVKLVVTSSEKVDGVDALLEFDPAYLQVTQVTPGTLFASHPSKQFDNTQGTISISALAELGDPGEPVTTSGTVATVTFKAKKAGKADLTFNFVDGSTVDSNVAENGTGNDILNQVTDGSYTVTSEGDGATTTTTTGKGGTSTPKPAPKTTSLPKAGHAENMIILLTIGFGLITAGFMTRIWQKTYSK